MRVIFSIVFLIAIFTVMFILLSFEFKDRDMIRGYTEAQTNANINIIADFSESNDTQDKKTIIQNKETTNNE